ncbi:hypothetical protein [Nocardia sp. NPDC050406]|uniref:hypothetical protein n=1 Tax=Nocardia sp. NPDC050406 TaxID=3364318 RepID=UPI00379E5D51
MTDADQTMLAINDAVVLGRQGDIPAAREALVALWDSVGVTGDALHRCTIAHYLADLYDHAADSLTWDLRALDAAESLTDERARQQDSALSVRGFYPSLHLNLADNFRRLGAFDSARAHLDAARRRLDALADDAYGQGVRDGISHVETALAEGSMERLATH